MVANGDRVSHVDGWSFHSDLPELTRDANVDSAQLLPAAVRAGHDLSSHGSRRSTNPFAAVIWQASCSTLALLSPTVRVIFSSSSSVCYTCEHGSRASQKMGRGTTRTCPQREHHPTGGGGLQIQHVEYLGLTSDRIDLGQNQAEYGILKPPSFFSFPRSIWLEASKLGSCE